MNFKKIIASSVTAALLLGITGCGTSETQEEKITATITVWSPAEDQSEDSGKWLQAQCEAFNEEHENWDLTFEYGVCSEGDAGTTIPQDPSAAGDVYMFANDQLQALIDAQAIAKLGGNTLDQVKANNSQTVVDSVSIDGSVYGVPFTTNTWFMYYDTSVFSSEDVKSLDTMLEKGKVAFPLSNSWYNSSFFLANGLTMFGEDGTDNEAGIQYGGEAGLDVVNYLVDLVANQNFANDADGSGIAGMRNGTYGAFFSGSWDAASVKEILGDNLGAAQLPTITINGEAKQLKSFAGSKAIGVNPNSEYPEVAVALAAYLGSDQAQKSHYEARNIIPCSLNLLEDETLASDPVLMAQNDTINNTAFIQPTVAGMSNYWKAAEVFGQSLVNKEINHTNASEKLEAFVASLNANNIAE